VKRRFLIDIQSLKDAWWLGALLMGITSSYTLVKISRDALFLSVLPARLLPWVYLLVGVVTIVISWAFGRLTGRFTPLRTLIGTITVSTLGLFAAALGIEHERSWLPMAFYVWVNLYGLILVSQFWAFVSGISDPRTARTTYAVVGAGGILGGLGGGLLATWLANHASPSWITGVGAALLGLTTIGVAFAAGQGKMTVPAEEESEAPEQPQPIRRVSYVRWLAIAALCSVLIAGLLDYQLKTVVQRLYPSTPALTRFFGHYFIAMNIAALLFQIIGTRRLLEKLGVGTTAVFLPAGITVGAIATLFAPTFALVLATRLWDNVLRFSLNKSTTEIFYFPLTPDLRRRAKAFIEAGIERFGDALAGVLILGLGFVLRDDPARLAMLALAVAAVWLFALFRLQRSYVRQLGRHLRSLKLDPEQGAVSLRERSLLKEMVRTLDSGYEREVLQSIDLLESTAPRLLVPRLPKLLAHRSAPVRARAIAIANDNPTDETSEQAWALLKDPDPMVRLQAVRLRCSLRMGNVPPALDEFLDSPDPGLRGTALQCLVEYASEADLPRVRALIEVRLQPESPDRVITATALGARATGEFHDLFAPLLEDPDLEVRRAALTSVGRAQVRAYLPALIEALGVRETEAAAREGLVAFGEGAVGTLGDWLADERVTVEIRRAIPRALRHIPTQDAVAALFRPAASRDVVLDYRILKAANQIRLANPALTFPTERVTTDLDDTVREFLATEFHLEAQKGSADPAGRFLLVVLDERRSQALNRIFRRLALLYPPRSVLAAYHGILSANPRVSGNAIEYIDNAVSEEHRALIKPLLPDADPDAGLELAKMRYGLGPMNTRASLAALLDGADLWVRTCALFVVGQRREQRMLGRVEDNLDATDERVRETAVWAKQALMAAS
jgi:AAA family ATP:ADP antiporter